MAIKPCHLIPFLLLIFLLLSLSPIGDAKRSTPKSDKKPKTFDFIKKLKGCHKGNNTKEVHKLKAYLEKFGYLNYDHDHKAHATDDNFDEYLESAVRTYQKNYHIKPTGIVDDETISRMTAPRCGVPDIINGTNYMERRRSKSHNIHTVSHYSFFPNKPKWPQDQTHLTYGFEPAGFLAEAVGPVARAFQQWEANTRFTFEHVERDKADLVIGFRRGAHDDGPDAKPAPFDGPGKILAHAFAPKKGLFHYDGDETWSVAKRNDAFHLETVAAHEIGHLLGLEHSQIKEAIMYASIDAGEVKSLHQDDIAGIADLYSSN